MNRYLANYRVELIKDERAQRFFNPNRSLGPVQIVPDRSIVGQIVYRPIEGVAGYADRGQQGRCRQTNKR